MDFGRYLVFGEKNIAAGVPNNCRKCWKNHHFHPFKSAVAGPPRTSSKGGEAKSLVHLPGHSSSALVREPGFVYTSP